DAVPGSFTALKSRGASFGRAGAARRRWCGALLRLWVVADLRRARASSSGSGAAEDTRRGAVRAARSGIRDGFRAMGGVPPRAETSKGMPERADPARSGRQRVAGATTARGRVTRAIGSATTTRRFGADPMQVQG